jgi:hypothetical protein
VGGGPGISVGIVTDYGLDGPGSNPGGDEIFPPVQTGPGAHAAICKMGTGSFPGAKCGRGALLTTYYLLVPRSWKSRAIPYPPCGPHRACNGITLPLHSGRDGETSVPERHKIHILYPEQIPRVFEIFRPIPPDGTGTSRCACIVSCHYRTERRRC